MKDAKLKIKNGTTTERNEEIIKFLLNPMIEATKG